MASDEQKYSYIRDITVGLKNVNIQFIILEMGQPFRTKAGQDVWTVKIADPTGSVDLTVWNEIGECLHSGDICRLRNGFTGARKGCLQVNCGKFSELLKIGEFTMAYSELPNLSAFNSELVHSLGDDGNSGNGNPDTNPDGSSSHKGNSRSSGNLPGSSHGSSSAHEDKKGTGSSKDGRPNGSRHHKSSSHRNADNGVEKRRHSEKTDSRPIHHRRSSHRDSHPKPYEKPAESQAPVSPVVVQEQIPTPNTQLALQAPGQMAVQSYGGRSGWYRPFQPRAVAVGIAPADARSPRIW